MSFGMAKAIEDIGTGYTTTASASRTNIACAAILCFISKHRTSGINIVDAALTGTNPKQLS
jgi:hypothetical protein